VDTEDDLQPLVWTMYRDSVRAVRLVAAAMATATFDAARLEARAAEGGTTTSELADTLVRDHGMSFKTAHAAAGRLHDAHAQHPRVALTDVLAAICLELCGRPIVMDGERLREVLSPRHFVDVRRMLGGPAPEEMDRAIARSRGMLDDDRAWLASTRQGLGAAGERLRQRSTAL
jgi:argininosuccinate lyase